MSISASIPRGRDGGEDPPAQRQKIHKAHRRIYVVLYDPFSSFSAGRSSFTHQEINGQYGMIHDEWFQGARLRGPDGREYEVREHKLRLLLNEGNKGELGDKNNKAPN